MNQYCNVKIITIVNVLLRIYCYCHIIVPAFSQTASATTIRPETFGALGNGWTDDTSAFQRAINSLTTGGTLLLGAGKNYRLNSQLSVLDNIMIVGESDNTTLTNGASGLSHTFFVNNKDHVHFRNVTFTIAGYSSNGAVSGHILFNRSKNCSVTNCTFLKSHWFSVQIKGESGESSENITVSNCRGGELAREGGDGNSPTDLYVGNFSSNISLIHNKLLGVGAIGIMILNEGGQGTINDVYVANNTIKGKDTYGIVVYDTFKEQKVTGIRVVGNQVEDIDGTIGVKGNAGAGIYLASADACLVDGNTVKNTNIGTKSLSLAPGGIGVNTSDNAIITNNSVVGVNYHGITFRTCKGITCTGNQVIAPRHIAIEIWKCSDMTLSANRISGSDKTEQCLFVNASNNINFSNNIIRSTGAYHVVHLDGSTTNNRMLINNNLVEYAGTTSQRVFTSVGNNIDVICKNNVFRNSSVHAEKRVISINGITSSIFEGNDFIGDSKAVAVETEGSCTGTIFNNNQINGKYAIDPNTTGLVFTLYDVAPPTAKGYAVGSKVYNTNPKGKGSPVGWIYTSDSTWNIISTL